MMKAKKFLALALAVLFALSILAGCGGKKASQDPGQQTPGQQQTQTPASQKDPDRTLKIAAMQDSGTLYPLGVTGGFLSVLYAFYEPLYDTKTDGTREWILATGLERISDLQYTLKIREGVTFSNGNPLTAEDVMFTMEMCAADPQFFLNVKVVDFEKTSVVDDYTIDLWYTEYNASQEPGLASMFIMDKESFDELDLSRNPIGTGPYTVTEYVTNSHVKAVAREDYWRGAPKIKNLEFKVINEEAQIINALETGDVDMATISITEADYVDSLGYDVLISNSGYNYVTLFSMLPGNPMESKEARWAVSHAIDRQAIVDVLFDGVSSVTDYPTSHSLADFEERFLNLHETYSTGYDPARAEELAEQAGLKGKKLRIITNGASGHITIAEMIQANLLDIGVDSEIVNYDQATYFGILMDASNYEIAIFTPSAPSMLAVDIMAMYITFIPLGWSGPERDKYGELSMGAISTYDPVERNNKLFEALKLWVEEDPWYGLCEIVSARAVAPDLKGYEFMIAGITYYHNMEFAA
ncbi:MAG TPA: ABC transporter substrate-binding protein [Papillibacter sp.]|jgi:peptide/nickel transport system substrate-binding protein|nr:ABC transporter substrate-binding protein [Papillibacter sp.]